MMFPTALALLLALVPATLTAAPTNNIKSTGNLVARQGSASSMLDDLKQNNGLCDLSKVVLPIAPSPLPPPSLGYKLRHIAIGRGTQNYTCASSSSTSAPSAIGAKASLFNVTCDYTRLGAGVLADISRLALNYPIPTSPAAEKRLSGYHEFTSQKRPLFKLQTAAVNYGFLEAKVAAQSPPPQDASAGPNEPSSVPWLQLVGLTGDLKEVYRVNTAGGVPPPNCQGMPASFEVQYSAEYWFFA